MAFLENCDRVDRLNEVERHLRLRQIPPETGRFIALLAATSPAGRILEIGTSGGYSTLWLALACLGNERKITTFEYEGNKAGLARETFEAAGVGDIVNLVEGDALDYLGEQKEVAFCFLDAEKEIYGACYDAVVPNLVSGGLLVADNAISHQEALHPFIERVMLDERVDALLVPIGRGELVCRRL